MRICPLPRPLPAGGIPELPLNRVQNGMAKTSSLGIPCSLRKR